MPYLLMILCLFCALSGCLPMPTMVKPSPLTMDKQKSLKCTLHGTWKLVAMDADKTDDRMFVQLWTFEPDYGGHYVQQKGTDPTISAAVVEGKNPYIWSLDGRNMRLQMKEGQADVFYRVDSWSADRMVWFNYRLSNKYTVTRVSDGDYSTCMNQSRPAAGDQVPEDETRSLKKTEPDTDSKHEKVD